MIYKKIIRIIFAIVYGLPIFILIISIRKFLLIRFQSVMSERIGHFTTNIDLYLCEKKFNINRPKIKNYIDIFCLQKKISNNFLAKKWSEKITIIHYILVIPIIDCLKFFKQFHYHEIKNNTNSDRDVHNLLDKTEPFIEFTDKEKKRGFDALSEFGICQNTKFVSIIIRDSSYFAKQFKNNYDYRKIKNYNIETFYPAIKFLIKEGYKVIIMGSDQSQKINFKDDSIFDYSNSKIRSDFLDIFIISRCKFFIRTSGLGGVAVLFRKPVLHLNAHLGLFTTSTKKNLLLPKNFYSKKDKRKLYLSEIFDKGFAFDYDEYTLKKENILLEESSGDILNATKEIYEIVENKREYSETEKKLQKSFKKFYLDKVKSCGLSKLHGEFFAEVSIDFLKKRSKEFQMIDKN